VHVLTAEAWTVRFLETMPSYSVPSPITEKKEKENNYHLKNDIKKP